MKRIILLLTLCVSSFAQEGQPRVIEIRNLDINWLGGFLRTFGVNYSAIQGSRFIALSGKAENIIAAEEALKRIDAPRKNIELTFQILSASGQAGSEKVPPDLEPVIKQLKAAFVYQGYRVIDTLFVRSREGSNGAASGVMPRADSTGATSPSQNAGGMSFFQVDFRSTSLSAEQKGTIIHIDHLKINGKIPYASDGKGGISFWNAGVEADVDVKEGQKVVVGKANVDGKDGAIFMIVTAKVVD
jgi:hypothetical protein